MQPVTPPNEWAGALCDVVAVLDNELGLDVEDVKLLRSPSAFISSPPPNAYRAEFGT